MKINEMQLDEVDLRNLYNKAKTTMGNAASNIKNVVTASPEKQKYIKVKNMTINKGIDRWKQLVRIKGDELKKPSVFYSTLLKFLVHQFNLDDKESNRLKKLFVKQPISNQIVSHSFRVAFDLFYVKQNNFLPNNPAAATTPASTTPAPAATAPTSTPATSAAAVSTPASQTGTQQPLYSAVTGALKNLGYDNNQIRSALAQLGTLGQMDEKTAIRTALQFLAKKAP